MSNLISLEAAIEALEQIRYALWEIDIPSPTVPEYIEHHEQVQSVMKRIDEIREKMERLPSAEPERKKGKWEYLQYDGNQRIGNWHCSVCRNILIFGGITHEHAKFCPNCGADMREVDG